MAKNIHAKFEYDGFYHVFNRTNNKEALYRSNANKLYFINLCRIRLKGYIDIHAMALLGNHFHMAIRIKSQEEITKFLSDLPRKDMSATEKSFLSAKVIQRNVHDLVSKQFSRVFNSYTQAFNKKYKRAGHLFHAPFKRAEIKSEVHLLQIIRYIHLNSKNHGIVSDFRLDKWNSYQSILKSNKKNVFYDVVEQESTLALFESRELFISSHQEAVLATN